MQDQDKTLINILLSVINVAFVLNKSFSHWKKLWFPVLNAIWPKLLI